jgi:hypothetical protein
MRFLLFIVIFSIHLFANDSTATLSINGSAIKIHIPNEFYIDLNAFRNFLNSNIQGLHFEETIIEDLTGDNLSDTLYNEAYIFNDGCVVESQILSNGFLIYSDSTLIFKDEGNNENQWGNDSIYYQLLPYSLLYIGYSIRVESYKLEMERKVDDMSTYITLKQIEMEQMGLSKESIEFQLNETKKYVNGYKGKFIHNISLSNPDTYIYETSSNRFVIFYSP